MAGAVSLHNFPEGFAVGVAFLAGLPSAPALAIAAQNVPEGLAVAAPLREGGASRLRSFAIAAVSGLTEPIAAVLAVALLDLLSQLMPGAMGFAPGAMIYVVGDEIIPESHSHGHHDIATLGLMIGFILMIALETLITG